MKATIEIQMDNDAFSEGNNGTELAAILRELADKMDGSLLSDGAVFGCRDSNGNRVGQTEITND